MKNCDKLSLFRSGKRIGIGFTDMNCSNQTVLNNLKSGKLSDFAISMAAAAAAKVRNDISWVPAPIGGYGVVQ